MKKLFSTLALFAFIISAKAQDRPFKFSTDYLDNGMKIVVCEDHSSPTIWGAVYVHVGSKNDPLDKTGMAHYFEHIMFKGTDKIGTIDWDQEKIYLDSIDVLYDQLNATDDVNTRAEIQRSINRLSNKATEYAIPNETDLILTKMGGSGLNAFTSMDQTVYYNMFPSNQVEKWMEVYAERFRNPVFRLFQSELETVYEEYNRGNDSPMSMFSQELIKTVFGDHPYGRPIIGYGRHLKNPQTSRMRKFYNQYYVAQNMTLLLAGDINMEQAKQMANEKFAVIPQGEKAKHLDYKLPTFEEDIVVEKRLTPIKLGALIFPGIKVSNSENLELDIATQILSNEETGLLDKLMLDNKLLIASAGTLPLEECGGCFVIYAPKILGQSHKKAEKLILNSIDSLINGNFDDELFESVKLNMIKDRIKRTENIYSLGNLTLELERSGIDFDTWCAETERLKTLTKADIVAVAKKYFGAHHISFRSKMGFPKRDLVDKPDWKPIVSKNTECKSEFAQHIESMPVEEIKPQILDFDKDVRIVKINDAFDLYTTTNTRNDIFECNISYKYGTYEDPDLDLALAYLQLQGSGDLDATKFQHELSKIGASIYFNASEEEFSIHMTGFQKDLPRVLQLCNEWINNPTNDEKKLKLLYDQTVMAERMMKNDAESCTQALRDYVLYGENCDSYRNTPAKEWRRWDGQQLIEKVRQATKYNGYITLTASFEEHFPIRQLFLESGLISDNALEGNDEIIPVKKYDKPIVFYFHNSDFSQSNILFNVSGNILGSTDRTKATLFDKYFGTDMFSIVFQEIREFRSLGYMAYGRVKVDEKSRESSRLWCAVGTQSDKTIDAIDAMMELITDMPTKQEKFEVAKQALIFDLESDYIQFRQIPAVIHAWKEQNLTEDPRPERIKTLMRCDISDVKKLYQTNFKHRPVTIILTGNMKRVDMKKLEKYGELREVKYKEMMNK